VPFAENKDTPSRDQALIGGMSNSKQWSSEPRCQANQFCFNKKLLQDAGSYCPDSYSPGNMMSKTLGCMLSVGLKRRSNVHAMEDLSGGMQSLSTDYRWPETSDGIQSILVAASKAHHDG
jgi:hypothetical protein